MLIQPDYRHPFQENRLRSCHPTILLGVGGLGRILARFCYRMIQVLFGGPCPLIRLVEFDLASETGRDDTEPAVSGSDPDQYTAYLVESVEPARVVSLFEDDPGCPLWESVLPNAVRGVTDTRILGAYANPQAGRLALEFDPEKIRTFCLTVADQAERLVKLRAVGWNALPVLHLLCFQGPCGSVGSNALCLLDKLVPLLPQPARVLVLSGLIADKGRVPDPQRAQALQQAFLTEIKSRAR